MSAPIEDIFNYETAIEEAWVTVLKKAGQQNVYVEHSDENKTTPWIDVELTNVVPTGRQFILYPDRQLWAQPYDMWSAQLVSKVVTFRGRNSDQHRAMLARIRVETFLFADRFSPAILPYHKIVQMKESGLRRGFDNATSLDWSEVAAEIKFWVNSDAWPVSL